METRVQPQSALLCCVLLAAATALVATRGTGPQHAGTTTVQVRPHETRFAQATTENTACCSPRQPAMAAVAAAELLGAERLVPSPLRAAWPEPLALAAHIPGSRAIAPRVPPPNPLAA